MFCKKCGEKLQDGALFCGKCGTAITLKVGAEESEQAVITPNSAVVSKNEKNEKKKILSLVACGILLVVIGIVVSMTIRSRHSTNDYVINSETYQEDIAGSLNEDVQVQTSETVTTIEEEIAPETEVVNMGQPYENVYADYMGFTLDGIDYHFPVTITDIMVCGRYELDSDAWQKNNVEAAEKILQPGDREYVNLIEKDEKYGTQLGVSVQNKSDDPLPAKECFIVKITLDRYTMFFIDTPPTQRSNIMLTTLEGYGYNTCDIADVIQTYGNPTEHYVDPLKKGTTVYEWETKDEELGVYYIMKVYVTSWNRVKNVEFYLNEL